MVGKLTGEQVSLDEYEYDVKQNSIHNSKKEACITFDLTKLKSIRKKNSKREEEEMKKERQNSKFVDETEKQEVERKREIGSFYFS